MQVTTVKRQSNGRGRPPVYEGRIDAIAGPARQLAEMILALIPEPELQDHDQEDLPF